MPHKSNQKLVIWNLDRPSGRFGCVQAVPTLPPSIRSKMQMDVARSCKTHSSPSSAGRGSFVYGSHKLPVDSASRILPYASDARNQSGIPSSIEHLLNAHTRAITDINWSPFHPEVLASCSVDTWTWIWDLRMANSGSGRPAQGYSSWNASMTQVKWNRGIEHRIAASCDDKVLIWDDRFGALPLVTLETRQSKIYGLDWSLPGNERNNRLMTCSLDGTIKFWDLDSPSSRRVAAHYARIDQPESTIETLQPVWRARHLPFGHGAISVAQRGDTAATLWAYGSQEPVCRFEGHTDLVKEFVIRSRSGSNANLDDRTFQLVTWSKDQTLRLWPISADVMRALGHIQGAPMHHILTESAVAPDSTRPSTSARSTASTAFAGAVPVSTARSLPTAACTTASRAPTHGRTSSCSRRHSNLGASSPTLSEMSVSPGLARFSSPRSLHSWKSDVSRADVAQPRSLPTSRINLLKKSPRKRRARRSEVPQDLGPQMRYTQDDASIMAVDAVQWMANVRVGELQEPSDGELSSSAPSTVLAVDPTVLPHEILRVNSHFPNTLESIDIAHRRCTVAVSGPWHNEGDGALAYLRVMFTFPRAYPREPPAIEIERSASIPFKTRAELYRSLVDLVEECTMEKALCLEACVAFLVQSSNSNHNRSSLPSCSRSSTTLNTNNGFARSYQAVADAVMQLTLRSTDMLDSSLVDMDIVQLMSTNVLGRAQHTGFPSMEERHKDSIPHES